MNTSQNAIAPDTTPQFIRALQANDAAIHRLRETLDVLETRLVPILRVPTPETTCSNTKTEPIFRPNSPLTENLNNHTSRIDSALAQLVDILERLEV